MFSAIFAENEKMSKIEENLPAFNAKYEKLDLNSNMLKTKFHSKISQNLIKNRTKILN